jgi:multidrug/hemolysin transport system permease protein
MLMVQDKANSTVNDFSVTPIDRRIMSLGYYIATLASTLIICFAATGICLVYIAAVGFYMSLADVLLLFLDVFILVMFGVAISSIINFFLSTQGQISAVGSIISAAYGFICGAYMPISQFSEGLQKVLSFMPGTYGTSLIRNHAMRGPLEEMAKSGVPEEMITGIKDTIDCNIYLLDKPVEVGTMYIILGGTAVLLIAVYVLMNLFQRKQKG